MWVGEVCGWVWGEEGVGGIVSNFSAIWGSCVGRAGITDVSNLQFIDDSITNSGALCQQTITL